MNFLGMKTGKNPDCVYFSQAAALKKLRVLGTLERLELLERMERFSAPR